MPHWKLILAYDGTPYNGWQVQPNLPTVQGTLAAAIHRITGETVLPQGSGRTDTGVHALAQVATFSLTVPIPAANLHRALNRALPASIRILSIEAVPEHFHARHNALRKTYEYRILPCGYEDRICPPFLAPYVWPCRFPLDFDILQQAASHILGTHDFTSFAATDPDLTTRSNAQDESTDLEYSPQILKGVISTNSNLPNLKSVISTEAEDSLTVRCEVERPPHLAHDATQFTTINQTKNNIHNIRTIHHSHWRQQGDLLIYRITGNGFLHHMVRNLVGTFVEAAAHRISPDAIPTILAARNRSAAGPTAPASGLFLVEVEYK
ncbi:MAG TPA: tRNA pseudouridine synthase A [Edaphobacter sp.]|jgi:tRNA pseudouridine38-40 synthase|nr:tRNA pseudouridine synthase A [Edaphobacter sp.]